MPTSRFAPFRAAAVALALCSSALCSTAFGQSLEVESGSPLSIEQLRIDADVEEGVAVVTLDQTFRNATDRVTEGIYRMQLPEHAAVRSLSMWMAGKEKHGQVLESGHARRVYDGIVRNRKDPALLEQTGWRSFRVSVFPIPARDTVRIRMSYTYVLPDDLGLHTLSIPLPEKAGEIGALDVRTELRSSSGFAVVDCPTHTDARIAGRGGGVASVAWSGERVRAQDRLDIRFLPAGEGLDLRLLTHREKGQEGYFVIRAVPRLVNPPRAPRDVVFVIDTSGSMQGTKIEQARKALLHGLGTLSPNDRFDVLSFSSSVATLSRTTLLPANPGTVDAARHMARGLSAAGGTNIDGALAAALARRTNDPRRLFMVVLLTDGDPTVGETKPDAIVAKYREASQGKARLFAVGVGDGVKEFLLTHLAKDGRGSATYLRDDSSLEIKLSALFDRVHSPVLVDPRIEIEGVATRLVEPAPLPDLFRGEALVVAGRYIGTGPATLRLRGHIGGRDVDLRIPAVFAEQPERSRPHLAQLWGRLRIDALLDDLRVHGQVEEIRQDVIRLGIAHQIVTPYTSFLVVEDGIRIDDPAETARVPEGPASPAPTSPGGPTAGGGGPSGPTTGGAGRGGRHRFAGPHGEVPPESREPSDPPPRPDGGGPTTGGGDEGGPITGGGGAPPTGGGAPPTGGGAGGPMIWGVKGSRSGGQRDYSYWRFWWEIESAAALQTRPRALPPLSRTFLETTVFPQLRDAAADTSSNFLIRANAARALARLGDTSSAAHAVLRAPLFDPAGTHHRVVVDHAALLPLWSGAIDASLDSTLLQLAAPSPKMKFDRSYAALTLGLRGNTSGGAVTDALLATFMSEQSHAHQRAVAALSLGLLGDAAALGPLLTVFETTLDATSPRSGDDVLLVYVVDAVGRLGALSPDDELVRRSVVALRDASGKRRSLLAQRAVPRALARLVPRLSDRGSEQKLVVDHLLATAKNGRDASVRNHSLLALGRVAADAAVHSSLRRVALHGLRRTFEASRPRDRAYAAFALSDAARGPERDAAIAALRQASADAENDELRSALLLARARCGDDQVEFEARALVTSASTLPELRADAVLALGLVGSAGDADRIRPLLRDPVRGDVRRAAARSAGLLGDRGATDELITVLTSDELDWYSDIAEPLGRLVDTSTATRLLAIAADEKMEHSELTRALAYAALGRAGLHAPDPLLRVREDFHLRAHIPALAELLRIH